jgi:hypothetical protein
LRRRIERHQVRKPDGDLLAGEAHHHQSRVVGEQRPRGLLARGASGALEDLAPRNRESPLALEGLDCGSDLPGGHLRSVESHCGPGLDCRQTARGDVDGDDRIEIVLNTGQVLDSVSAIVEWEDQTFFGKIELLDIDGDGIPEVLTENPGDGPLKVFDVDFKAEVRFQ